MPASILKLEAILFKHGIVINKIFLYKKQCRFLELIIADTSNIFILCIPSYIKIEMKEHTAVYNTVNIRKINIDDQGDIIDKYVEEEIQTRYNNVSYNETLIDTFKMNSDPEKNIEEYYSDVLKLNNQTYDKGVYRQLSRLSKCVKGNKYKLCIHTDTILYNTDHNNEIYCYSFESVNSTKYSKLFCLIELSLLYKNIKNINYVVGTITDQLHRTIKTNFTVHINTSLVKLKDNTYSEKIKGLYLNKLSEYEDRISTVKELYDSIKLKETKIMDKKTEAVDRIINRNLRPTARDIEITKHTNEMNRKLTDINGNKKEIFRNLISLDSKYNNLLINIDNFCFNISVMLEAIDQNMRFMIENINRKIII